MKNNGLLLTILLLSVLVAACAQASAPEPFDTALGAPAAEPEIVERVVVEEAEAIAEDAASGFSGSAAAVERLVIRNASLTIVVEEPAVSVTEIGRMAEEMGGFVVNSSVFSRRFAEADVTADQGTITIRVPVERLDEALERIKEAALEIRSENVSGEDVTEAYTDLQSRLRNLEAAEAQLLEILNDADETDDVLRVFETLRQVREEIEVIKGQIQFFSEAARLSAITVELIPDVAAQPLEIGGWRPEGTAKEAVTALIRALRFLGDALIWGAICVLPVGLIVGVPAWLVIRAVLRRRRRAQEETNV